MKGGVDIKPEDRFTTLMPRLANIGGELLVDVLRKIRNGSAVSSPQSAADGAATRAPKITKKTARVDLKTMDAERVHRLDRGIGHQQPLWTTFSDKDIQLFSLSTLPLSSVQRLASCAPGQGLVVKLPSLGTSLVIRCAPPPVEHGDGDERMLLVGQVKPAGAKKVMEVGDWWNGVKGRLEVEVIELR